MNLQSIQTHFQTYLTHFSAHFNITQKIRRTHINSNFSHTFLLFHMNINYQKFHTYRLLTQNYNHRLYDCIPWYCCWSFSQLLIKSEFLRRTNHYHYYHQSTVQRSKRTLPFSSWTIWICNLFQFNFWNNILLQYIYHDTHYKTPMESAHQQFIFISIHFGRLWLFAFVFSFIFAMESLQLFKTYIVLFSPVMLKSFNLHIQYLSIWCCRNCLACVCNKVESVFLEEQDSQIVIGESFCVRIDVSLAACNWII